MILVIVRAMVVVSEVSTPTGQSAAVEAQRETVYVRVEQCSDTEMTSGPTAAGASGESVLIAGVAMAMMSSTHTLVTIGTTFVANWP